VPLNEWGFAAEIKSWWDAALAADKSGLDHCNVEDEVEVGGSQKRSDLTVLTASGDVKLAGELRLPDHPQHDPWDPTNLLGAINKAQARGADWAFTSDANALLLIDCRITGPVQDRVVQIVPLGSWPNRASMDNAAARAANMTAWVDALSGRVIPLITGAAVPVPIPADERFIQSLRGLLQRPVRAIADALDQRRQSDAVFKADLIQWMVDEQNWAHVEAEWPAEIRRTALLTAYVFTTRLMFYEALRRAEPGLSQLAVSSTVPAAAAQGLIRGYFKHAQALSKDYETLFNWDRACDYALIDDTVVTGWAGVVDRLAHFDLAKIDYDVVGRMFERLIDPHERYRYGQHYTIPAVVDLMLSLGLEDSDGPVADPSCGGGTFLVRAYARIRTKHPSLSHQELLERIYGIDISAFASSLATVNLAVRDLVFQANYPRVETESFFKVRPGKPFMRIPDGSGQVVDVVVPKLRALTCNPPYVRVQKLSRPQRDEAELCMAPTLGAPSPPARIYKNSNYHVYFWWHGARFLEETGRLVFITSGEWLDSDYGVPMQTWLMDNFKILLLAESLAEPWFSEARVGTVICAAERCTDAAARDENLVRWITFRRTLDQLYGRASDPIDLFSRVDTLRDRLLGVNGVGESEDFDWKTIDQASLRELGTDNA
jgi:hypothetical protein